MLLTNVSPPADGIRYKQDNTTADIDGQNVGIGTLYIAESCVSWSSDSGQGFSLEYPNVSLHAVSTDLNTYPHPCLYLMIDGKLSEDTERKSESSDEDESTTTDVRFIPSDKGTLNAMFAAMSECQALHPDEQDTDSEAEEECAYYEGGDGLEHLTEEGQQTLDHLENLLQAGQGDTVPLPVVQAPNGHIEEAESEVTEENQPTEHGRFEDADMEH